MKLHRRIHTCEKPFACPDCDKKFTQSYHLKSHHRTHTGEKPFACPDCGKKFTQSGELKVHRIIHTSEKPFACPDCDKQFSYGSHLNDHRRIHTGEKPFVCPDCDTTFRQNCQLKKHRRIHTRERSFCDLEQNNEFIRHRNSQNEEQQISPVLCSQIVELNEKQQVLHTIEKPFVCHVCEEPFSEESLLENHVKIHPDAEDFLCERNFSNFIEQRKLSLGLQMPVHTDDVSIVPSECNMICSASSGNCVLDGKVDDGDVHMNADKLGYWIHRHHAARMKNLQRRRRIQTRSNCMGVAYVVNHFQRRKKQCIASTVTDLNKIQMSLHPRAMLLIIHDDSWSVLVLSGNLLRFSEFTLECTKY